MHQEEVGDRVCGLVAGYLLWAGLVPFGPQAISVTERLTGRQLGPLGRELVATADELRRQRRRLIRDRGAERATMATTHGDRIELRGLRARRPRRASSTSSATRTSRSRSTST